MQICFLKHIKAITSEQSIESEMIIISTWSMYITSPGHWKYCFIKFQ